MSLQKKIKQLELSKVMKESALALSIASSLIVVGACSKPYNPIAPSRFEIDVKKINGEAVIGNTLEFEIVALNHEMDSVDFKVYSPNNSSAPQNYSKPAANNECSIGFTPAVSGSYMVEVRGEYQDEESSPLQITADVKSNLRLPASSQSVKVYSKN